MVENKEGEQKTGSSVAGLGGVITDVLSVSIMILTAPVFLSAGLILVYFYHVDTISAASPWFSILPNCLYGSAFTNLLCSANLILFRSFPPSLSKRVLFLLLLLLLSGSCLLSGLSTFACFQLQSVILQPSLLSLRPAPLLLAYMEDAAAKTSWDDLQRRLSCCGVTLFNSGFEDWRLSYGRDNDSVPDSCCHRCLSLSSSPAPQGVSWLRRGRADPRRHGSPGGARPRVSGGAADQAGGGAVGGPGWSAGGLPPGPHLLPGVPGGRPLPRPTYNLSWTSPCSP